MDPLQQLEDLARAAEEHARREHGLTIGVDAADQADRALRNEAGAEPRRVESLAACYGAWLGRLAARRWQARWVGLSEAAPPRLRLRGIVVSPVDAVRRRLSDPKAPSLPALLQQLEQWARPETYSGNREAWDRLASDPRFAGWEGLPRDRAGARAALDEWVRAEGVDGKDVLCLGAGGGRQGPLHALAGARVTVVDFSEPQLDHDRRAAEALGLKLKTVRASLERLEGLADAAFDLVIQPVSTSYVREVTPVYAEVARVTRPGGLYVVQHKQPAALQAPHGYALSAPCADGYPVPSAEAAREFVHTLDALVGGLCRAGFVIEDFTEPPRADALAPYGSPGHRAWFLPPYLKIKARRRAI